MESRWRVCGFYYSTYDDIDPLTNGNKADATTDETGRFSFVKKETRLRRTMRLILVKDGFEKDTIGVGPKKEPESYESPVLIAVAAQLRRQPVEAGR